MGYTVILYPPPKKKTVIVDYNPSTNHLPSLSLLFWIVKILKPWHNVTCISNMYTYMYHLLSANVDDPEPCCKQGKNQIVCHLLEIVGTIMLMLMLLL